MAERVATEQGVKMGQGQVVGFIHRGERHADNATILTYATDGIIAQRLKWDSLLSSVRAVIIDEAHERTLATDLLLGFLKDEILPKRPDLKVIIVSATLDAAKFQSFFGGAERVPLLVVKGRTFPVAVQYSLRALNNYINSAVRIVFDIHRGAQEEGNILVFMPGKEEIAICVRAIEQEKKVKRIKGLDVFPLLSGMDVEDQRLSLYGHGHTRNRRCIVATNYAETSITIDGVRHVVVRLTFLP